ncbi:vegetative cell wall protein gp1-like [Vitis riparia]|uniref:vegetative cell wall protein gp1-like n=1 Tax=Vitis riparia TaxID=96939 RepID=UPI00155A3F20|nr:vegetative cell wall protein gp1-like [Vitis riparia]
MARTRGAKSSSPSARKPAPREPPVQASTSEPPRPEVVSPPVKPTPKKRQAKLTLQTPPARRYLTRSGGRPLQKRARVESSEPIGLTGQSPVPSPEPTPVPSPAPPAKPQASQPPPSEPQIPSEPAPEAIIRRPMLTQPPIEGNLDCRARPFHSKLCFDTAAFQLRPELEGSFQLLRRYRMEQLLTPRDFFYPRVALDFYQSMTTQQVRD